MPASSNEALNNSIIFALLHRFSVVSGLITSLAGKKLQPSPAESTTIYDSLRANEACLQRRSIPRPLRAPETLLSVSISSGYLGLRRRYWTTMALSYSCSNAGSMRALGMEPKAQWKGRRRACTGYESSKPYALHGLSCSLHTPCNLIT